MYYAVNYPDEVEAIIGINESNPNQTKTNKDAELSSFLTLLNKLGIIRNVTYLLPSADNGMNKNNYYTAEQMKIRKMATTWNSMNVSVINEANAVKKIRKRYMT